MCTRSVVLLFLLLGLLGAEAAWAHGGRGIRRGASGYENELRLARLGEADLTPDPAGAREGPAEEDAREARSGRSHDLTDNVGAADYDWRQWWAVNRWDVLPDRAEILKRRARWEIESGKPPPDILARRLAQREARRFRVGHDIVPALLRVLDPASRESPEVRAAALLALGKCVREVEHLDLLWEFARDRRRSPLVRRCAALAMGLLRRSRSEDRFSGETIDVMRRRLFELFDDEDFDRLGRAFAMYAVGLLADQPHGKGTLGGRVTAREIWRRLDRNYKAHDLPVALLTAFGMYPRVALPKTSPEGLKKIVEGTWIQKRRWNHYERGHAMSAQARLRAHEWNRLVWYINSTQRRYPTFIRMSTFLALADQVEHVPDDYRSKMAVSLIVSMRAARNILTRGLAHVAMARLLNEDLRRGSDRILEDTRAFKWLVEEARYPGKYYFVRSSFAVLGVGLAAHDLGQDVEKGEAVRIVATRALANMLEKDKHPLYRASCVAALGCAEHEEAVEPLLKVLGKRARIGGTESYYAPVALGQLGRRTPLVMNRLRSVYSRKSISAELRSQVLLAQVMLGDPDVRLLLLRELRLTTSTWAAAQITLAVGLHDDLTIVSPIVDLAEDKKRSDAARAYAYASLGFLGDPEDRGSILRLLIGSNYVLRTASSTALQTIL